MDAQWHRAGYTSNRQLAGENRFVRAGQFDVLPRESNRRMFLPVEKGLALEEGVAPRFTWPDSRSFDPGLDGSRARVRLIEDKRAVDIFEMAADKSHHHVTHTKLRRGMPRFEKPFGHYPLLSSKDIIWTGFTLTPTAADSTALSRAPCPCTACTQQVEVIRHQDIGVERERVALAHAPKRFDEGLVVTLPEENLLPVIATG